MAAYRSSSSANSLTSSVVVTKPTGAASGDALTIMIAAGGVGTIVPPSGWTLLGSQTTVGAFLFAFYSRLLGGSEPSTYTFTSSGASAMLALAVDASGTKLGYGQSAITTGTATTAFATSSITTFQPSSYILTIFQDITGAVTWTTPTGETNRIAVSGGAANDQIQVTAGATGAKSSTASSTTSGIAFIVSIEEQPTLTLGSGSYSLSGHTASLLVSRILTASSGSYSLSGHTATLLHTYAPTFGSGSYSLSGHTASLLLSRVLNAGSGSYTLSGHTASLSIAHLLNASSGSYTLSGHATSLLVSHLLNAGSGSYALSGHMATLLVGYTMGLGTGSYALSGHTASVLVSHILNAGSGTYVLTGSNMTLTVLNGLTVTFGSGNYQLSGRTVTFVYTPVAPFRRTVFANWEPLDYPVFGSDLSPVPSLLSIDPEIVGQDLTPGVSLTEVIA
jgi:hypothetical protein